MKKVLLTVVGIMFAATSFAQNALVASLSNGEKVSYYYGVNALKQAVEAAASGDIINLSGGVFNATDITKAITLHGAGIDSDNPTIIVGNFNIEIASDDAKQFMMEGIRCQDNMYTKGIFANPYFLKCQFKFYGYAKEDDAVTNVMFVNCKITSQVNAGANNTLFFVNSYVSGISHSQNAAITATNCVLNTGIYGLIQSQFFNCIFFTRKYTESRLPAETKATNCYFVEYDGDSYAYDPWNTQCVNCGRFAYTEMFKDFTGNYTDAQTFELAEGATTKFPGLNGEQIGLYGGLQPYNSIPSYPLITKMEVGEKTNEAGQLSVEIEVK